jgi:hypothetical protein
MKMIKKKKDGDPKKALLASVKINKARPMQVKSKPTTYSNSTAPRIKEAIRKSEPERNRRIQNGTLIEKNSPSCSPVKSKKTKPSPPLA